MLDLWDMNVTQQPAMRHPQKQTAPRPREVVYCDWDTEELDAVAKHGLTYTIRSSKYPRTLESPRRVLLTVNKTHTFSIHAILLKTFSSKIAAKLKAQPSLGEIHITGPSPITSLPAWKMYLEWLYTFDKIPLPDFTPLRLPHWTTSNIRDACFLASFLGATKFEKFLLRIIFKEVWDGDFPIDVLWHLNQRMGKKTGMWFFSTAYFRWKESGCEGELDPYRWRVEHWYSICGTLGNWGCFHAMNTSGWGGVWERQRLLFYKHTSWIEAEEERRQEEDRKERKARALGIGAGVGAGMGMGMGMGMGLDGCFDLDNLAGERSWDASRTIEVLEDGYGGGGGADVSGEEMWEEWWEDDDMYSRLDLLENMDIASLGIEDVVDAADDFAGFEGEMEQDEDFAY